MSAEMDRVAVLYKDGKVWGGLWWANYRFEKPGLYWSGRGKTFRLLPWRYRRVPR